jgi:aminoglycoside 3-N-acetyltransferase
MITYRQLSVTLNYLELDRDRPVIMHASLSSFGQVTGGAETLLGAVLATTSGLMMPAFTYKTMVTPEVGPPDNGIVYGGDNDRNLMAEFYHPDMPVDPLIGRVAESLRKHPRARRSMHPILSFTGVNVDQALAAQTMAEPLAPLAVLEEQGAWVLMVGVDHTTNTSLHYAEKLAGRKQFIRWALTQQGVVECPGFPGTSLGFQAVEPHLERITRRVTIGNARIQALPLEELLGIVTQLLENDPEALLPEDTDDLRVQDTRKATRE